MKKVVVIGPESTGKSTLCEQLAARYKTAWVPEYARQYLLENGSEYKYDDLLTIAAGQIDLEDSCTKQSSNHLLFIDTNMYVMKIWCEFVFGKTHQFILDQLATRSYDLYLLCYPDLPWTKDLLREYPDLESRLELYHMYRDSMIGQHVPWVEIKGKENERLGSAIQAVERLQGHF